MREKLDLVVTVVVVVVSNSEPAYIGRHVSALQETRYTTTFLHKILT